MSNVAIVDFGAGNLLSVARAFEHLGAKIVLASTPEAVAGAERLVLPGVGAFGACMAGLKARELAEPVKAFANSGRPFFSVCVGLQMLFEESEEFGAHQGLGLIPGKVTRLPSCGADGRPHKIPHIGWNAIRPSREGAWQGTCLRAIQPMTSMYFVHSFVGNPADPAHRLADCDYNGVALLAALRRDNVTGCQFHPEKSGPDGLALLSAFLKE